MTPGPITGLQLQEDGEAATHLLLNPSRPSTPNLSTRLASASLRHSVRRAWHRGILVTADVVAVVAALQIVLRAAGEPDTIAITLIATTMAMIIEKLAGLYERDEVRVINSTLDEIPTLIAISGLLALGTTMLVPALANRNLHGSQIGVVWLALGCALISGRVAARWATSRLLVTERLLVLGDARQAKRLHDRLDAAGARAKVIAAVPLARDDFAELAETGMEAWVRSLVDELNAHRIVIAPHGAPAREVPDVIRVAKAIGVSVSVLPGAFDCIGSDIGFEDVNGMAVFGVRTIGLSATSRLLKRTVDLAAALAGLVVISPLLAVISVAIRLDSGGPIFFRQTRVGKDGRHFEIIKFRSMVADAEALKDDLRPLSEAGEGLFKMTDDPRVTRTGRLLRRSSLDEIPQILNVLKGEMSLVGPRPLVIDEDAVILGLDRSRLALTPGMTGPWQVLRQRVSQREMIEIDQRYATGWSLWRDVKILAMTVQHVLRRGNL